MKRSRRRALGQHFLNDPNIVRKILDAAAIRPEETVVEIGPGRGILTLPLARSASALYAIELDRGLHANLEEELLGRPEGAKVRLIRDDALTYPFEDIPPPFAVVANLPYSVSTPLLFRLLTYRARISRMVLMLQREVARRLVAGPGDRDYSPLSIGVQFYSDPRLAFTVPRGCFKPPPNVDSAVVRLGMRAEPKVSVRNEALFFRVVRAGFGHRRKSLRNALRDGGFSADGIENALTAASIIRGKPQRRAETLSLEEFARLADALDAIVPDR